jgi:Core-2/I-Branching enzyme
MFALLCSKGAAFSGCRDLDVARALQVDAERRLLRAALKDPANQRFMLLSEACLPLYPPHVVWAEAFAARLSRVHACKQDTPEDKQRRNVEK